MSALVLFGGIGLIVLLGSILTASLVAVVLYFYYRAYRRLSVTLFNMTLDAAGQLLRAREHKEEPNTELPKTGIGFQGKVSPDMVCKG